MLIIAVVLSSSVFAKMDSTIRPLFKAVKKGQNSEVTHLLKQDVYKSKINATVGKKKIPLLFIAAKKGSRAVVETLLKNGADPTAKDADKITALMIASEKGYTSIVKLILDAIPDKDVKTEYVNAQDEDGSTALFLAIDGGSDNVSEVVRLLIDNRADSKIANNEGDTPVELAREYEMASIVSAMTKN